MSYIYSDEVRYITREFRDVIGIKCDECDKEIHTGRYFKVKSYYEDCDLTEHTHICSNCIRGFIENYLCEAEDAACIEITAK